MVVAMPRSSSPHRSALGLIVLTQLAAEPMHVYRMQKLFEAQGKDRVVNVRSRASLYQTIERLVRNGLVHVTETVRVEGYPDRVIYATTPAGREIAHQWLRAMLRDTGHEYPDFIAAVSIMFVLAPQEARAELETRAEQIAAALADTESAIAGAPAGLPRLFMLEEEYRAAVLRAELSWVRGVTDDLREGRLTWSDEWLRQVAAAFIDEHDNDIESEGS
jgi:DNA-binding PadR family transcriptional regulator